VPVTLEGMRNSTVDIEKCELAEQEILDIFNKSNLNLKELLTVIAQTLIDTGGTLENVKEKLRYDDMWRYYSVKPTAGNALMALGADILAEWLKVPEEEE